MERRQNPRNKRRIPCEFRHEGQRYRGIAVNLSRSGLFIQTNATLDPDVELEIVVRDDADWEPPAVPGAVAPAPEISEEAEPEELLDTATSRDECDSAPPAESESKAEEPARDGSGPAEGEEVWPPETLYRSEALVIDDGELDDVYAMLEALGADPLRHQTVGDDGFRDWEKPPRVVVVSARAAARLTVGTRASESGIVTIAVAEAHSQTLCEMLRRQGFDYVVRRPVHPDALRLLLMRALFRGSERRSEARLPIGCEVTAHWGIRRRPATLLEISSGGCSFLGRKAPKPGRRISLRIPRGVTGERRLTLRGRVRRSERRRGAAPEASAVVVLAFDPLSQRTREHLERLLAAIAAGPLAPSRATEQISPDAKEPAPETGTDDLTEATR